MGIIFALIAAAIASYFVPTLVAGIRNKRNTLAIFALNLFLGWTFLGWVGCLVWSLLRDTATAAAEGVQGEASHVRGRLPSTILILAGPGLVVLGYGFWYSLMSVDEEGAYVLGGVVAASGLFAFLVGAIWLIIATNNRGGYTR